MNEDRLMEKAPTSPRDTVFNQPQGFWGAEVQVLGWFGASIGKLKPHQVITRTKLFGRWGGTLNEADEKPHSAWKRLGEYPKDSNSQIFVPCVFPSKYTDPFRRQDAMTLEAGASPGHARTCGNMWVGPAHWPACGSQKIGLAACKMRVISCGADCGADWCSWCCESWHPAV